LHKPWIKICGITRHEDALLAAQLGADAIGLNFYADSPRVINVEQLEDIVGELDQKILVVALFVNPDRELVDSVISTGKVNFLQFHGSESPSFCESFSLPYMKVFRVGESENLIADIRAYSSARYILLDSFDVCAFGGTGKTFDWPVAAKLVSELDVDLVVAGGLSPENVAEAVALIKPFGVDISSGVEAEKGIKDAEKMKLFIEGASKSV
jgi:phosphoribosylanthranilate isomerase